jgi:hypothetical protein
MCNKLNELIYFKINQPRIMKKITSTKLLLLLSSAFLFSCGKTSPGYPTTATSKQQVLNFTNDIAVSDTAALDSTNLGNPAIGFTWSNVNPSGTTTDSGNMVHSYTLQIDAINGDFSSPYQIGVSNLEENYVMSDVNGIALGLNLTPDVKGGLKARVVFTTASNTAVYSNVDTFYVYPYVNN